MKTISKIKKRIIGFMTILPLVQASWSQDLPFNEEAWEITPVEIASATLVDFKAIYNTGSVYLKWLVKNEKEDGLFIIERSGSGKNFEAIAYKQGIGVPLSCPILYCSIDKSPLQDTSYYRLVKTLQDGRFYCSEAIMLVSPPQAGDDNPVRAQKSIMDVKDKGTGNGSISINAYYK